MVCMFIYIYFTHVIVVLHPCHKLAYFRAAGWPQEWINTAEKLVCSEFKHSYASRCSVLDAEYKNDPTAADDVDKVCTDT
jgi:hypothetical protein